jgi:hypothetical protein
MNYVIYKPRNDGVPSSIEVSAHYIVLLTENCDESRIVKKWICYTSTLTITIWPPMNLLVIVAKVELICFFLLDVQDSWIYNTQLLIF